MKSGGITMKKFYYIVGAVATAAAIFALIVVMLKKLKISLCIEGIDDEALDDTKEHDDITLTFENSDEDFLSDEDMDSEIETIITEDGSDQL